MDLNLRQEEIKYIRQICKTNFTKEETAEVIVPDALPDIMRILDTDAAVLLRSKEADNGRLTIAGIVSTSVIYIPDGVSGVRKMETNIPFSVSIDNPDITQDSKMIVNITLASADAKAVNPRKIMLRANLTINAACYAADKFQFSTDVENGEEHGLEVQHKSSNLQFISDVCEKTFILSDEYKLPSAKAPIAEVLKTVVKLRSEDAKNVGSKIIFKGTADIMMYYRDEAGELESAEFSTTFSQIIETEFDGEGTYDIETMLTGVYVTTESNSADEERNILIELHAVAQCVVYTERDLNYIFDTYSTKYTINAETTEREIICYSDTENVNELVRGTIEIPAIVRNIIGTNIHVGMVTVEQIGNEKKIRCDVNASVTFMAEDGRLLTCNKKFAAEKTVACESNIILYAEAWCGSEIYTALSSEGIDIRLPINFKIESFAAERLPMITLISCDNNTAIDFSGKPSVILKRVERGDTLWKLAKQYNSQVCLIKEANGIEDEYNLEIGRLLIIPRKK